MKKTSLLIAMSAALPGLAAAAPPVAFDSSWSLNADGVTIDYVCPAGFTCSSAPVTDNNFIQVQMTDDATGKTYFQTVIATDNSAGGNSDVFVSESFVTTGAANGGISANQTINNSAPNAGVLKSTTILNTGSFNNGAEDQVSLTQGVWDAAVNPQFSAGFTFNKNSAGDQTVTGLSQQIVVAGEFADEFTFSQTKDGAGNITAGSLDIVSGIVLNAPGALSDQTFRYSQRRGATVADAGSATFAAGNVAWAAGETVERVLIGQTVDSAGDFGYERVGNLSTSSALTEFSLASMGPFSTINPVDPFGAPGDPTTITVPLP